MERFKTVTSKDNPLMKRIVSLQSSAKARSETGFFVLEGLRICEDAFQNGVPFQKLVFSESAYERYAAFAGEFSCHAEECYRIPDTLFKKISDTTSPQGVLAVCPMPANQTALRPGGRYIALENLSDPSNLGAVARTAEALGLDGILLSGGCDPYAPKALRASMGTLLRVPLTVCRSFPHELKATGLTVYSCVVDREAEPITGQNFKDGCIVVIGNEANGVTPETRAVSDKRITIPMKGRAESLNAAVAAAIAIWEMMRSV